MNPFKRSKVLLSFLLWVFGVTLFFDQCLATPQLNQQDPYVIYSFKCSDKFYEKKDKMKVSLGLAPFYQQTHYARDGYGHKVRLNQMNGAWNMLATFFNIANSTSETFNSANYPNLWKSYTNLRPPVMDKDYTLQANYVPETMKNEVSFISGKSDYEKLGLRGKIGFDLGCGIGINVKTGVVDYKYTGTLEPGATACSAVQPNDGFYNALLTQQASNGIFNDLDLDIRDSRETSFEDTHVEVYFQAPFHLKDDGETIVTVAPYFSVGAWLPTGEKKYYKKFYSLPTGNNGHYGGTIEGSINFDFPGTIQLSVGGGVLISDKHEYPEFRFPTNDYQSGFYPWLAKISEEPGDVWYFNASFKAENFLYDLSFYFDYVYTYHEKDEVTITDSNSKRLDLFNQAKTQYVDNSTWKDQKFNAGLSYKIVNQLSLGVAIQAHISGVRVFKSTTEMAYIDFSF